MAPSSEKASIRRALRGAARLSALVAGCVAVLATVGEAQMLTSHRGVLRAGMTDVGGPPVTSGDMVAGGLFGPGTVKLMTCPVAWGVRDVATATTAELRAGQLRAAVAPADAVLPVEMQQRLYALMVDGDAAAAAEVQAALAPASNARARRAAADLVQRLSGLLAATQALNPAAPTHRTTQQMSAAVGSFNRFVETSSDAFLSMPPAELPAIQAVLSRMVIAALENEGRTDYAVGPEGAPAGTPAALICAPPVVPVTPSTPPPVEHAIRICVLHGGRFQEVPAVFVPATNDTLAIVNGRRTPFSEAYPDTSAYARQQSWYVDATEIRIDEVRYTMFGLPFVAPLDGVVQVGDYRGVPLFAAANERPPYRALYLLAGPRCELVEFREAREVRRVRG